MDGDQNDTRRTSRNLLRSLLPGMFGRAKRNASESRRSPSPGLGFERLEDRLALTVVINEFLAENVDGIEDSAGHTHDWIELQNTGGSAVDIAGWSLTDDLGDPTKYQIPTNGALSTLDPGEMLLVYASGNNSELGWIGNELHANFQLSLETNYLGLYDDFATLQDEFNLYPQQYEGISFGRGVETLTTSSETLITTGAAAKYRVFTGPNAAVDDFWREINYDDSTWNTTTTGVGWDNDGGSAYDGLIPTPISPFSSPDVSAYVRVPFTVTNKAELLSMQLNLIADNGYIVFLNGREVQRARLATDLKIGNDWELNSRQNLPDSTNATADVIDLTDWLDTIEEGANLLAIYGANHTSQQGDFLIHPELTAQRANGSVVNNRFMVTPSPGLDNGAGYEGIIEDTVFTNDRGFYTSPFSLGISTDDPLATIRYTIDGTRPTLTNGSTYSGTLAISPSLSHTDSGVVTVRAAAFRTGHFPTNVDTQTYIFLDDVLTDQDGAGVPNHANWGHSGPDWDVDPSDVGAGLTDDLKAIPTVSLVTDWEELFGNSGGGDDDHGIYTQTASWRNKSDERLASLEFFTADGSEEFQIDAKVEIQGHSSTNRWNEDKLSLEVKFKQPFDTRLDSETLFVNSAIDGSEAATRFDSIILDAGHNFTFTHANPAQNAYARYINDQVVADLINSAGGDSPHGRFVHLYINGMYWGVYNAHEKPESRFASEYFGGDEDDYYVVKAQDGVGMAHGGVHPEYLQVDGGISAENAFQNLLNEVTDNMSNLAEYQEVEQILDIDAFIDYMIVHYYAGNWDWGQDNWYATFNHISPAGKWRFHSWDQEHAFNTSDSPDGNDQNSDYTGKNDTYGPTGIHNDLMGSPEYELRFSDRVERLMRNGGILTPTEAQAIWQTRIDELSNAINGETARWGDNRQNHTTVVWQNSVQDAIDSWFPGRTATTIADFQGRGWLVSQDAPDFNQYGGEVASGFDVIINNPGSGAIYYTTDGSDPRLVGGAISGSAVSGGGPISITSTTRIRARVLNGDNWSAEVDKTFTVEELNPAALRIVEVHYNPDNGEQHEFIELLNSGATTMSLDGVRMTDFVGAGYAFQAGQTLSAGERIIVARNPTDFTDFYGGGLPVAAGPGYDPGNLSNGGELISLLGPSGELIQRFTYNDAGGWPTAPDGEGPSLEYIGPLTGAEDPLDVSPADPFDDPTNWQPSAAYGGSPGADGTGANHDPVVTSDGGGPTADVFVPDGNTAVTTVMATDIDLPPQTLTFSITGGADSGHFGIGSSTGVLTFNSPPVFTAPSDSNFDGVYIVEVTVDDDNGGADVQTIDVTVTGPNQDPMITSDGGGATANLNQNENNAVVATITAADPDLPLQTLTYSVSGGADSALFSISASSGVLTFDIAPDFENPSDAGMNNIYEVEVTVDDGFGGTDAQSINIAVTDDNDDPVIVSDGGSTNATVLVAEGATAVTAVTATDEDVPAQTVTFSISGGADAAQFGINASSGVLTFLAPNDFENPDDANMDGVYNVEVTASDGNGGGDLQFIDVVLTDVNDDPMIISNGGGAIANLAVADGETTVTTVTAADPDFPPDTLTFSITGGVDASHFGIVGSTGVLTFNSPPDINNPTDDNLDGDYAVEATVSDGQGGTDVQTLNVTIVEIPSGDPGDLRIVELHYNPASSWQHEFIELLNAGSTPLSLDGVEIDLNAGARNYVFPDGLGLNPGARIVVPRIVSAFTSHYPSVTNYTPTDYGAFASLGNTAQNMVLFGPGSVILQKFYYEDGSPWPSAPDGSGPSMEYIGPLTLAEDPFDENPADPFDVPTNWVASAEDGGSPGVGDPPVQDADFNDDTLVTGADFLIWQRNSAASGAVNSNGDANGDSQVNEADFNIWESQYGSTIPVLTATTSSFTSPSLATAERSKPEAVLTPNAAIIDAAMAIERSNRKPPIAEPSAVQERVFEEESFDGAAIDYFGLLSRIEDVTTEVFLKGENAATIDSLLGLPQEMLEEVFGQFRLDDWTMSRRS